MNNTLDYICKRLNKTDADIAKLFKVMAKNGRSIAIFGGISLFLFSHYANKIAVLERHINQLEATQRDQIETWLDKTYRSTEENE